MKWYCTVCGYVHEGDQPPEQCPVCKQPASKFKKMEEEAEYATVHKLGEGKMHDTPEEMIQELRANFDPRSPRRSRDTPLRRQTTLPVLRSCSAKC